MSLVFVDTNILAYVRDSRDTRKQRIAMNWMQRLAEHRTGRLSWQVLMEFYAVATHPKKLALAEIAARADVVALQSWRPVAPDGDLLQRAWHLQSRYGFSWWDAMIVAAALAAGCTTLLSEDLHHQALIDDALTLLNPFAEDAPGPAIA